MKYKAKECRCWSDYPNHACKKLNGQWKCLEYYELIQNGNGCKKTRCKLKEGKENEQKNL